MRASLRPQGANPCLEQCRRYTPAAAARTHSTSVKRLVQMASFAASASAAPAIGHDFRTVASGDHVQQLLKLPFPPVSPLIGKEKGSFAEETITTRLPTIMETVIQDMRLQAENSDAQIAAILGSLAAQVKQIQADMPVDAPLQPLAVPDSVSAEHPLRQIIPTTNAAVAAWQQHITQQQQQQQGFAPATWLQLPWLVVECYLYVRLATIIASEPSLVQVSYDPFFRQKAAALTKSMAAAADIAASAAALLQQQQAAVAAAGCGGQQQLAAHFGEEAKGRFYELLQYGLWGNKVDLSLLTDVSHLDVLTAASSSKASSSNSSNIIVNEYDQLWEYMKQVAAAAAAATKASGPDGLAAALPRVDIILDNAGLELYTDLVLADYLVSTGLACEVVLHGKQLPWFVSDTLEKDLHHLLEVCSGSSSTNSSSTDGNSVPEAVTAAAKRWQQHLSSGRWRFVADVFWTTPHPFWWMEELAPELYADLAASSLVIFKGDLNYRKLAGDCRWPPTTAFTTALTGFCPAGLLSLRTLKADVIAGLASGEAERLEELDDRWQVNGKFGVVQFAKL